MHVSLPILVFALIFLVIFSAFFSGSEIGMMSINRYRLRHLVKLKDKQALKVHRLLSRPDKLLGVILIGNTMANVVASAIATIIGQRLMGDLGVVISTIALTLIILVFSEMTPKTWAALAPQRVAFKSAFLLQGLQTIFSPLVSAVSAVSNGILKLFGISMNSSSREMLSGEELRSIVHETGSLLPVEHKSMLVALLDLEQARVEDIMIPKADIIGIDVSMPWNDLTEQLETIQHTRIPLYRRTMDDLVGIVHVRSLLNLALEEKLTLDNMLAMAETPYFVPETTPLNVQLLQFQKMKRRSCFVVDEYGELQGLATLEDILEEVVGEFTTDMTTFSQDILPQEDGSIIIDASLANRYINRVLGWSLPLVGPRTLSGLIIEYLGYIPPADCCLAIDSYRIEILKTVDNTIKSVRIRAIR